MGVTASAVRMTPWMIHGWRPTSVTIQPASVQTKPMGAASTSGPQEPARVAAARCRRHISQSAAALDAAPCGAEPDHDLEGHVHDATGGQSWRGKSSRPFTSACRVLEGEQERP